MTFRAQPGRMTIDAAGRTVFDTNDGLFHTLTSGLTGTRAFGVESAGAAQRNETVIYEIGTCDAGATHLIGAVYLGASDGSAWGVAFNRWTTYLGGTVVWALTAPGLISSNAGDRLDYPHTFCGYTFSCSGGVARVTRRLMMPPVSISYGIKAHTLRWSLEAGYFS